MKPPFSNRFPVWVFEVDPGTKYVIKPSRNLFGKQRYGLAKSEPQEGIVYRKHDYQTQEKAEPWLNALNLYAEMWSLFDDGDRERIKKIDLILTGDSPRDHDGYSDRSILANVLYHEPAQVFKAFTATQ